MAKPTGRPIRDELIDATTALIQRVGVTGFSYGDLAKLLDIKAPSIHHHFRTKEDLIAEVASTYRETFGHKVAQIPAGSSSVRLQAYGMLFTETARAERLCLCGAVSADWLAVGDASRQEVERFFAEQRRWLAAEIAVGVEVGEIRSDIDASDLASAFFATLQGSVLLSRSSSNPDDTTNAINTLNLLVSTS